MRAHKPAVSHICISIWNDTVQHSSELYKTQTSQCIRFRFEAVDSEVSFHTATMWLNQCKLSATIWSDRASGVSSHPPLLLTGSSGACRNVSAHPEGNKCTLCHPEPSWSSNIWVRSSYMACSYPAFTCSENSHAPAMCVWVWNGPVALYARCRGEKLLYLPYTVWLNGSLQSHKTKPSG